MSSASKEIDAIIKNTDGWRGKELARLRGVINAAAPGIVEEVKWKKPSRPSGAPVWACDGNLCVADILKNAVRLTFFKGKLMKDPKKLFNARLDSSAARAIDFFEGAPVNEAALKALIREAIALNAAKSLR